MTETEMRLMPLQVKKHHNSCGAPEFRRDNGNFSPEQSEEHGFTHPLFSDFLSPEFWESKLF